jgi:hypothetical protein
MKCPICEQHTTSFADLGRDGLHIHRMPFVRTCPHCGTHIRLARLSLIGLLVLLLSIHAAVHLGIAIADRYQLDRDGIVILTLFVFAVPACGALYFLWKNGKYDVR